MLPDAMSKMATWPLPSRATRAIDPTADPGVTAIPAGLSAISGGGCYTTRSPRLMTLIVPSP